MTATTSQTAPTSSNRATTTRLCATFACLLVASSACSETTSGAGKGAEPETSSKGQPPTAPPPMSNDLSNDRDLLDDTGVVCPDVNLCGKRPGPSIVFVREAPLPPGYYSVAVRYGEEPALSCGVTLDANVDAGAVRDDCDAASGIRIEASAGGAGPMLHRVVLPPRAGDVHLQLLNGNAGSETLIVETRFSAKAAAKLRGVSPCTQTCVVYPSRSLDLVLPSERADAGAPADAASPVNADGGKPDAAAN